MGCGILEQVFGAACDQDSPYARYTADTLAQLAHNARLHMEAMGCRRRSPEHARG